MLLVARLVGSFHNDVSLGKRHVRVPFAKDHLVEQIACLRRVRICDKDGSVLLERALRMVDNREFLIVDLDKS